MEGDLAKVQEALVGVEEARHRAEVKTARLEVKRKSLLLELGVAKDELRRARTRRPWRKTTRRPWR